MTAALKDAKGRCWLFLHLSSLLLLENTDMHHHPEAER